MPKILRITTAPQAIRAFLTEQASLVANNGIDIILVSGEGEEDWKKIKESTNVPTRVVKMARGISLFGDLKGLWDFIQLIRAEKPDIVHTMTPKAGLLGMLAARICNVPIRIHDVVGMVQQSKSGVLFYILDFMERLTYSCAQELIPNSFSLRDYIISRKMAPASKVKILGRGSSHGINLNRFNQNALQEEKLSFAKKEINFDPQCRYITAVGRMVKDKGINELVAGFNTLQASHQNLKLLLIGPFEPELDPLEAKTLKIIEESNDIIHISFSTMIEYYLSLSTILVHASHREGLPNVLLEAGAMQCPIVCAKATGNVDVVQHEETGLLFNIADEKDLVEKVDFALNNPTIVKKYSDNLYQIIHTYFKHTAVNQNVLDNYFYHTENKIS
jgi:glycosyltransferase involved in cell wall biosynthesis